MASHSIMSDIEAFHHVSCQTRHWYQYIIAQLCRQNLGDSARVLVCILF